jgi:hypothetical protein
MNISSQKLFILHFIPKYAFRTNYFTEKRAEVWAWYKVGKTYEQVSLSESEPRVEDNPSKSRRRKKSLSTQDNPREKVSCP